MIFIRSEEVHDPRKVMVAWARRQATKRGFPPGTDQRIHIVVDGETCLYDGLAVLFPQATFALDIRHVEERLWKVGRTLHGPDPNAVADTHPAAGRTQP